MSPANLLQNYQTSSTPVQGRHKIETKASAPNITLNFSHANPSCPEPVTLTERDSALLGVFLRYWKPIFGKECHKEWNSFILQNLPFTTSRTDLTFNYHKPNTRGMICACGDRNIRFLMVSLRVLEYLNVSIPIEVWYGGDEDLSPHNQELLSELFPYVQLKNIFSFLKPTETMKGWNMKPWIILLSSFEEVILWDADTYFFQNPTLLFNHSGYVRTGALFYKDRLWGAPDNDGYGAVWKVPGVREFLDYLFPNPSSNLQFNRIYLGQAMHQIESGCIVINKSQHLLSLITVGLLISSELSSTMQTLSFHGEKEFFWLAFELLVDSYAYDKHDAGIIGSYHINHKNKSEVCGNMVHVDEDGKRPFWINSGVEYNKNDEMTTNIVATHFTFLGFQRWEHAYFFCQESDPIPLDPIDLNTFEMMKKFNTKVRRLFGLKMGGDIVTPRERRSDAPHKAKPFANELPNGEKASQHGLQDFQNIQSKRANSLSPKARIKHGGNQKDTNNPK